MICSCSKKCSCCVNKAVAENFTFYSLLYFSFFSLSVYLLYGYFLNVNLTSVRIVAFLIWGLEGLMILAELIFPFYDWFTMFFYNLFHKSKGKN